LRPSLAADSVPAVRIAPPTVIRTSDDLDFLCFANRARRYLEVDLSGITWISPMGVVGVLATCLAARERNIAVRVLAPRDRRVRTYLDRVGLYAELERQGWGLRGNADLDGSYRVVGCLPVQPLQSSRDIETATNRLEEALKDVPVVEGAFSRIITVVVELTENAREHGSACYVVAQMHSGETSGTPGIHVAVADFGPGFSATMRQAYGRIPDEDAVLRAFESGVSGTGLPERGFGLDYVRSDVATYPGATLAVMTRRVRLQLNEGVFAVTVSTDFRGTLAAAYFPYKPAV